MGQDKCIYCHATVTSRQEALMCDGCSLWQHRICNTGIDQNTYRNAVHADVSIYWLCKGCTMTHDYLPSPPTSPPQDESSRIDDTNDDAMMNDANDEQAYSSINDASSPIAAPNLESSVDEPTILEMSIDEDADLPVTYEIVEGSTKRRREQLVDSNGYAYSIQRRLKGTPSIIQRADGNFIAGKHDHNHPGNVGINLVAKITKKVKDEAATNIFKPASAIVNEVLAEELGDKPCPGLPKPDHMARAANRVRQRLRPDDPKTLDFMLEEDHIPDGFLSADVTVNHRRHLIFASEKQLKYLAKSKSWYIDGTFKLCRRPFEQLLSINAFVRKEDHAKQVPLLFVIMAGRKKRDYKKVLQKVLEILPLLERV